MYDISMIVMDYLCLSLKSTGRLCTQYERDQLLLQSRRKDNAIDADA